MAGNKSSIIAIALAVFISRLPFLFEGYGSEEDAWGLILVARNISLSGIYEVSRLPGHPVQELLLSLLWNLPPWALNLFTALVSTAGVVFFMLTLKERRVPNYIPAALLLAFTPVFYINSSNLMDYTWALSLVMISFYFVNRRRLLLAGIFLGLACGFRITAGAMVIPFAILLLQDEKATRQIFVLILTTCTTALVCFIPAIDVYGVEFFTFYEYFPYPPFLKNVYKGTVGAWGVPGFIAVVFAVILSFKKYWILKKNLTAETRLLLLSSILAILLYTWSFIRIPQKSAFVIPVIPFIAIIFAEMLTVKQMKILCMIMIISCFSGGIHLDDPIRGSKSSAFSVDLNIGNTPVAFDLLNGPVTADHTKRKLKIQFASHLADSLSGITEKSVIIAGWWQNELKYFSLGKPSENVSFLYYADEPQLRDSIAAGNKIFFIPGQDFYNDLRFRKNFTKTVADPL